MLFINAFNLARTFIYVTKAIIFNVSLINFALAIIILCSRDGLMLADFTARYFIRERALLIVSLLR